MRRVLVAAPPPPIVDVRPTREIRTASPVNEVAVDGGRAATLVGAAQAWEYLLVWSPKGIVVRASLACDTQESNVVLAQNRFAHVCFQSGNYVVTGTLKPLKARIAFQTFASVALAGQDALVAGSVGRTVWRFDTRGRVKLRTYPRKVIVLAVDSGRILVDRDTTTLDVLSRTGHVEHTLPLPHAGGALMRGGRLAAISGRRLTIADLTGRVVRTSTVARGAHLEDFDGTHAIYSVETRLHLLRLSDGRDVRLRLRNQFGYAHARLDGNGLFYAYTVQGGTGRAGYVASVEPLLR